MWTKDLKFRTNLQQTQLTRVMRHPYVPLQAQ